MNVADFILRVRYDYNDIDADRVEDPLILDYLNEAQTELYALNPRAFVKSVVAKLDESDLQQPCCCDILYSVDAVTDAHGNFKAETKEENSEASGAFGKKNCKRKKSDSRAYSRVKDSANQFIVKPPVSPNETVYLRLTCAVKPEPFDENSEIDDRHYAALLDYVLYRLFSAETESATSQQKAAMYFKQFQGNVMLKEQIRRQAVLHQPVNSNGGKR
ncbi:hypothetical protein E4T80_09920 [Muribacter muris]|uniref:Uncharacterized protein n=1 Tax=Muribacter muris TaxID=67855 RepID=A0A4Y9JVR9_9PAST|nr:DUF6682 family protein [Muribacter muris]MBF0785775.1 hypothetical protein [Muribacter muris]MBF0828253.1 hypothetical protein [Muribacter muris]TFV08597.1 hypothetical protein E4T80_09920 [Muribacter muris]